MEVEKLIPKTSPIVHDYGSVFRDDLSQYPTSPCLDVTNTPEGISPAFEDASSCLHEDDPLANSAMDMTNPAHSSGYNSELASDSINTPPIHCSEETISDSGDIPCQLEESSAVSLDDQRNFFGSISFGDCGSTASGLYSSVAGASAGGGATAASFAGGSAGPTGPLYPACTLCPPYEACFCSSCVSYVGPPPPSHHPAYQLSGPGVSGQHLSSALDIAYSFYPQGGMSSGFRGVPSSSFDYGSSLMNSFQQQHKPVDVNGAMDEESSITLASQSTEEGLDQSESLDQQQSEEEGLQKETRGMMRVLSGLKKGLRRMGPRNKPLNEVAVTHMEKWYMCHVDHPYPTYDEKEELARLGCITVAQVNSWFANRRNRSDNTRPKKNRKQLQIRLYQFSRELETATSGGLRAYDIARRLNLIIDEFLA